MQPSKLQCSIIGMVPRKIAIILSGSRGNLANIQPIWYVLQRHLEECT